MEKRQQGCPCFRPSSAKRRVRAGSRSGQREVIFSHWRGEGQEPEPFLSIYRLTGSRRSTNAAQTGRFILQEEESVIYAAKFYDSQWDCGLDQADLLDRFVTISPSWYS